MYDLKVAIIGLEYNHEIIVAVAYSKYKNQVVFNIKSILDCSDRRL